MTESAQKKRKWDLDDQGQTRPEGTATKISKVDDEFPSKTPSSDQGEAAMNEATAKINAILAQKGLAKKEPTATAAVESQKPNEEGQEQQSEQQQQRQKLHPPPREKLENEFVKNIPINDLKNRYMLTRGATQAQIQRDTGADVTTRGKYYPDKALATDGEPPLYLYVSASSQESLDKAVAQIEDLIANAAVPTVVPPHRQDNHHQQNNHHHPQERPPRKFHEEKIYVGLESTPHFNLRAKIVGPHGAYVKHIQNETGSRVQLKGKGSGFYETATGQEAEDALHVHITCIREEGLEKAVQLTKDLLATVKTDYERGPPPKQYGGYYGGRGGYRGGYHGGHHHHHGGYGYQGGYQPAPPPPAQHVPPQAQPQPSLSSSSGTPTSNADDSQAPGQPQSQPQSHSATPTSSGYEGGEKNAAPSYGGYDYSQYYAYYGQYQYDPSYYNYYGYSNAPPAATSQPSAANPPPPPPLPPLDASPGSSYQQSQQAPPPPPPPSEDARSQSYNAVPPPPPPPQE